MGTFTSARRHVLHTFANTQSAMMKRRVAEYMLSSECPLCHGKRLRRESLSVTFAGLDIADISRMPIKRLGALFRPYARRHRRRLDDVRHRASGKGDRDRTDRRRSARPRRRAARFGAWLFVARAQHADALAGRTAAPPARHAGPFEPLRRRLRPRRAVGGASSGGHRSAACVRSIDSRLPAIRCSSSSTSSTSSAMPTGSSMSVQPRDSTAERFCTAVRRTGSRESKDRRPAAICSATSSAANGRRGGPPGGCGCAASPATTCTTWTWTSHSASSRP